MRILWEHPSLSLPRWCSPHHCILSLTYPLPPLDVDTNPLPCPHGSDQGTGLEAGGAAHASAPIGTGRGAGPIPLRASANLWDRDGILIEETVELSLNLL